MKTLNKILWIAGIVLGLASVVLFFTEFATVTYSGGKEVSIVGAQFAFGGKIKDVTDNFAKSAHVWFCFWLSVLSTVFAGLSFKTKKLRYAAPATGLISAVYMLVLALLPNGRLLDTRPLPSVTSEDKSIFMLITAIALILFTIVTAAHLLIDDYLEVKASKGAKLTVFKRISRFFRDYKSEVKKIVWPGWKEVLKNTIIVIIMCLIVGAVIWVVDYGLAELLALVLGI